MRPLTFVLSALLSLTLTKSAGDHDTLKAAITYESSEMNPMKFNDSKAIETLFIPEDLNKYQQIMLQVRKLFMPSTSTLDKEILHDSKRNTIDNNATANDQFSNIDNVGNKTSSSLTREGNEEKYLQRNSVEGVSPRTTVKNNEDGEVVPVRRNNDNTGYVVHDKPDEEDLLEAVNFGLRAMKDLYLVKEPMLYSMGLYLDSDNPARHVAVFNSQTEEARVLAKYGFAILQSADRFRKKFPASLTDSLLSRRSQSNPLQRGCPNRGVPNCPPASLRYRTSDGSCNNLQHLWWGSAMSSMQRFLPPVYSDGIQTVRTSITGNPLPSSRQVSTMIHEDRDIPLASVTHMLMQWGQFVDHDLTATGQSRGFNGTMPQCCLKFGSDFQPPQFMHPECLPITVNWEDSFFGPLGVRCLEFVRSGPAPKEDCKFGPREQLTQVTSFLDASTVYSSNALQTDNLRLFRNGLLQYGKIQSQRPQLPKLDHDLCKRGSLSTSCFRAGDGRVGEQPALVSLHVAFLRLHNRIATKLAALNPHWNDEKLFQESRRIIGAIVQHITYREFLPIVLGQDVMKIFDLALLKKGYYEGYDSTVNPTIVNEFSTAAYRFGHSLVQHSFIRFNSNHEPIFNNVSIHEEFTNPANLETAGSVDRLILGLINQPAQRRDEHISEELTNHLFQTPNFPFGMDLASINIQRGRDHGIPPYVQWRDPCGLSPIKNFDDLHKTMPPSTARKFKSIYSAVDDIDLFTAGLAEKSVIGGLVGPTFACIIGQQFSNLRKGDRFWYENSNQEGSFTPGQLQQIRRVSLAQVLCSTMDNIETVQPFVFLTHDTLKNQRVSCNNPIIGQLNLEFWAERPSRTRSRANIVEKIRKKFTVPTVTNLKPAVPKYNNSGTSDLPIENRFNVPSSSQPPTGSIHQVNRVTVKKPLGPPDNYTIIVHNNAVNSPVFVNGAIYGSNIRIDPSLNQQTEQKSVVQEPFVSAPGFLPPPRPIPTRNPLENFPWNAQPPYIPYAFHDPNNPNPLSQGFQPGIASKDVLFESFSGSSPRPTLYTYYTNFQKHTTATPPQPVDHYLINYASEDNRNKPSSLPESPYQHEQLSRPSNYGSPESNKNQVYEGKYEGDSNYREGGQGPSIYLQDPMKDSTNSYRPESMYTAWPSASYDKTQDSVNNQQHSNAPAYQKPIQTDADGGSTVPGYQTGSIVQNIGHKQNYQSDSTVHPANLNPYRISPSERPFLHDEFVKNPSDHRDGLFQSTSVYSPVWNANQPNRPPYQNLARPHPLNTHSVTIVTEPTISQTEYEINRLENRVTNEVPKPLRSKIGNSFLTKPGQYYYEKNVLHRYPDKLDDKKGTYNVEQRRKVTGNGGSIEQVLIDTSVRKQQVISLNGKNTSVDTINRMSNESSNAGIAEDDWDQEIAQAFSEEIGTIATSDSTSHWLNPEEDTSLQSAMEVPKIASDRSTAANELPMPLKFRNYAS